MKTNVKTVIITQAIILVILAGVIIFLVATSETPEEKDNVTVKKQINEKTKIVSPDINISPYEIAFTVNLGGGMEHGELLTISGYVPYPNSTVTGMIYHGNIGDPTAKIVRVLQTTANANGFYSQDVRINDEYLWEKGVNYTISIGNKGEYKTLEFSR